MKQRTQLLLVLAILFVIVAAAFLLLDFRLQQAETGTTSNASTYSFATDEETSLPLEQDLELYVQAPPGLEDELVAALRQELVSNPYVRDVNLQEEPPRPAEDSVLVVEIDEPSAHFWSPFYAHTAMTVNVSYASDGEVAWIDEEVAAMDAQDPPLPVVRVRAEHRFDNTAYGLISRPGYRRYVAEEVAKRVNRSLAGTLTSQAGTP